MSAETAKKRTSENLLDFAQVADMLNVSTASIRRLVSIGKIPSIAVTPSGRKRMITRASVQAFIEEGNRSVVPPPEVKANRSKAMRDRLKAAGWDGDEYL